MSNEIQSISQSNYILHNIDAKKLYVQEPLFTANSGDAVYVGWRPDETVLFQHSDDSNNVSAADLSEDLSAFNKVKIYYATIGNHSYGCNEFELSSMGTTDAIQGFGNNSPVIRLIQFDIQNTRISVNRTIGINFSNFGTTPSYRANHADDMRAINKVVGIGRKENA